MATVALQVAGNAALGPAGGIAIGILGGIIDQQTDTLGLLPTEPLRGQKLDDLGLQQNSEGSAIPNVLGRECGGVAGTVIWASRLRAEEREEEIGKGSFGQTVTSLQYFRDVAVLFARRSPTQGAVEAIDRILFDLNVAYEDDPDVNIVSTQIEAIEQEIHGNSAFPATVTEYRLRLESPNGGPDLSTLRPGNDATIQGFTTSGNNAHPTGRRVIESDKLGSGVSYAIFRADSTIADEAAGDSVTLTQVNPQFDPEVFGGITLYLGDDLQTADPTISAAEGAGLTPGNKFLVYVVFTDLNVTETGGRPSNMQAVITEDSTKTVGDAVADIIDDAIVSIPGLSGNVAYDVSALTEPLLGHVTRGPASTAARLTRLVLGYDLQVFDDDGVLTFLKRANVTKVAVPAEKLASSPEAEGGDRPLRLRDTPDKDLPKHLEIAYLDKLNLFQNGSAGHTVRLAASGTTRRVDLALVLEKLEGVCIAKRVAFQRRAGRWRGSLSLPPSIGLQITESDLLEVPGFDSLTHKLLLEDVTRGANYLFDLAGRLEDQTPAGLTTADCAAQTQEDPDVNFYTPLDHELFLAELPPLRGVDETRYGVYYAGAPLDPGSIWGGFTLYKSLDDGTSWRLTDTPRFRGLMGRTTTALGSATGPILDLESTVNVRFLNGEPTTITLEDMLRGENRALCGDELIGWTDSTQESDGTWTLGGTLLRGLRGTEAGIASHSAEERFVVVSAVGINFLPLELSELGGTRDYKALPAGGVQADFDAQVEDRVLGGGTLKPLSPWLLEGSRDGSDNVTITWKGRTRARWTLLGPVPYPELESPVEYDLEILDGSTVVRTFSNVSGTSQAYTAAEQTTDGLTPGDPVTVRVYKLSATVGRGKVREATVAS